MSDGDTIKRCGYDCGSDGVMARRAAPGMHAIAQNDNDHAMLWDDYQRRSGKAGVTVTSRWCRTHEVRSVDHPSQSARQRQP